MKISELFATNDKKATPVTIISKKEYKTWLDRQDDIVKNWLKANNFKANSGEITTIPSDKGTIEKVLVSKGDNEDPFALAGLYSKLPFGNYKITNELDESQANEICLNFALDAYKFSLFKEEKKENKKVLVFPKNTNQQYVMNMAESFYMVRDLINTPADILYPETLAAKAEKCVKEFNAKIEIIEGDKLINEYPAVYAVGKGASKSPRLIHIKWGNPKNPKIALVGKGVCFDTGGLNLKPDKGMKLMKKDMGGAAISLGLGKMIMKTNLPVCLDIIIPAVENSISDTAYHPSDVVKTRKGLNIEILNTDAEGRVILADALAKACEDKPELLIDFATLTGAARVALGPDIPAYFTNNDALAKQIDEASNKTNDYMWRLPLHQDYRKYIESKIADIANASSSGMAGAITAALFLQTFIDKKCDFIHIDTFAYNESKRNGRPEGGEAQTMKAIYQLILDKFCPNKSRKF